LFTGLIEEVGTVRSLRRLSGGARLVVATSLRPLAVGDSVAVDGVCQTVVDLENGAFSCDVLPETLRVSTFAGYRAGTRVNLERSLPAQGRLGGHIVNGHVDGLAVVTKISRRALALELSVGPELFAYVAPKGSIAVNGVSLTIGPTPRGGRLTVFITAHTWEHTNLKHLKTGAKVNIEIDIIAKYVREFLRRKDAP
jgi:riboflavin synthase